MALVYWIRKPDHTDIFTQGYVGVTSRTVKNGWVSLEDPLWAEEFKRENV